MNLKGKMREVSDSEDEKKGKKEDKFELKLPFDMKTFWKNINEKYFRKLDAFSTNDVNHLVTLYSKYGKNNFKLN